jgi:hypothetical protein
MTKPKKQARKTAPPPKAAVDPEEKGPSPAAAAALQARLSGSVTNVLTGGGSAGDREAQEKADEMVTLPRLDYTIIDRGQKIYPSEEEVEVHYSTAFSYGLVSGMDPNHPPGRIRQQTLLEEDNAAERAGEADDNGTGGQGRPSGVGIPASDLSNQPVTLDEIEEAAPPPPEEVAKPKGDED